MAAETLLPLFESQRTLLRQLLGEGRHLHHALLLSGLPGIGKGAFARALAQGLLCERLSVMRPPLNACGHCAACKWFVSGIHPDFRLLDLPISESRTARVRDSSLAAGRAWEISIDQVRELEPFITTTSARGHARVVLIDPAQLLSMPAANALLKMLEEPGENTWFLLVTHMPSAVPPTVRSRCRSVTIASPSLEEARIWLQQETRTDDEQARQLLAWSGMAPLHARTLADPALLTVYRALLSSLSALPDTELDTVADKATSMPAAIWYYLLLRWISDLMRAHAGAAPRFFPESASRLASLARRCSTHGLAEVSAALQRQAGLVNHPLNPRLFMESALSTYLTVFTHHSSSSLRAH
ncbi:MAG: AAA family ATPase [Lautropia sp.]|nr:AAA family ATPase [Lautropia sp.]